ncbi:hypothetical protein FGB62_1g698 [Gracilaria domingensis]|nr:hypothetical protein FGB62_1g698 [Gracilaria domingensis]
MAVALCFTMLPLVAGISFSSIGFGGGVSSSQQGVFGVSNVLGNGNTASIGTAASGGMVSGSTSVISPVEATDGSELSRPIGSPEAVLDFELSSILARGLQAGVPDYREASASPGKTYTTSGSGNWKTRSSENETSEREGNAQSPKVCWTMSKRCCYEEVQKGYECKDFYEYKYARCHPVIAFEQVCGEITERPVHHPQPKGRVKYEETVLKNYDARYGPHVPGYPRGGESEFYRTESIPAKPHGVSGTPFNAPQSHQPENGYVTNGGYKATGSNENMISIDPDETANDIKTSGAGNPQTQEQYATKPMKKTTEGAKTDPGSTYDINTQTGESHDKTLAAQSEKNRTKAVEDQTQKSYNAGATPISSTQGNGPSYRIATHI